MPLDPRLKIAGLQVDSRSSIWFADTGTVTGDNLERRVMQAAEDALAQRKFVTAIDVLTGLGWLTPSAHARWRQGRVDYLERVVQANLAKVSAAMKYFRRWAQARSLLPSETVYLARTPDRHPLQFSKSADPNIERAYRTHWLSPELSENKRQRIVQRQNKAPELVVIMPLHEFTCTVCGGSGDLLIMEEPGPSCLVCAHLDDLTFLQAGNAALTRKAAKASTHTAVVVRFSRSRKRYERQGLLVEPESLDPDK